MSSLFFQHYQYRGWDSCPAEGGSGTVWCTSTLGFTGNQQNSQTEWREKTWCTQKERKHKLWSCTQSRVFVHLFIYLQHPGLGSCWIWILGTLGVRWEYSMDGMLICRTRASLLKKWTDLCNQSSDPELWGDSATHCAAFRIHSTP